MFITAHLHRHWWNLTRFGLTPPKLAARWSNHDTAPRILCINVPKSGTHLLERALMLHPRLYRAAWRTLQDFNQSQWSELDALLPRLGPGQVLVAHLGCTERRQHAIARTGCKAFFTVRDPRDLPVSDAFYIPRQKRHFRYHLFAGKPLHERIRLAIEGDPDRGMPHIGQRLAKYAGWFDVPGVEVVRFEDLIGPRGGGDAERQHRQLHVIYDHLGLDTDDAWLQHVGARLFSDQSPTFRKGAIGQWRNYFDHALNARFNELAGDQLKRYGYAPE